MRPSYINVIYAKAKILLLAVLAIFAIFTASYQVIINLSPRTPSLTPIIIERTNQFSKEQEEEIIAEKEQEEEIIAEIESLPIEEVQRQLEKNTPEELRKLLEQGAITEEMMRELLIVLRGRE